MNMMNWDSLLVQERFFDKNYVAQEHRPLFSQDSDRLVFSTPFRRLANKTQVHPLYEHDHIHHRLIHSIETSMVGRSLGLEVGHWLEKEKKLSEKDEMNRFTVAGTVQAACIAHDIGNPPFGHSGEDAIGNWFDEYFKRNSSLGDVDTSVKDELTKFEGNAQGFRLVTKLDMYGEKGGMRLSLPVLGAFQKYPTRARTSKALGNDVYVGLKKFGVFESEWEVFSGIANKLGLLEENSDHGMWYRRHPLVFLVEAADDVCYEILDLEDAFTAGDLSESEVVEALQPIAQPNKDLSDYSPENRVSYLRAKGIGRAISSCIEAFKENYDGIMTGEFSSSLVKSSTISNEFDNIGKIATDRIFTADRKTELEVTGRSIIRRVLDGVLPIYEDLQESTWDFEKLSPHNKQLVRALRLQSANIVDNATALHAMADFVSGMTDRYAVRVAKMVSGIR